MVVALGLTPVQSQEDWRALAFQDDWIKGIDAASVEASGAQRTFRLATWYREDQAEGLRFSVDRYRIDCSAQTITIVHMSDYTAEGRSIWAGDGDSVDAINKGSVAADFASAVCDGDWTDATPAPTLKIFLRAAAATFAEEGY